MSDDLDLVMPFITTVSNGGPHDDASYTAGYEMGLLDAELKHARPDVLRRTIRSINVHQADLLAMRHGYGLHVHEYTVTSDGTAWPSEWTAITLELRETV